MESASGSTIGLTGEDASTGAFPQEKPHLSKAGWGMVIVESASGSTIGLTGEDASPGAFPQEKPHLSKAGWGTVIVESLLKRLLQICMHGEVPRLIEVEQTAGHEVVSNHRTLRVEGKGDLQVARPGGSP